MVPVEVLRLHVIDLLGGPVLLLRAEAGEPVGDGGAEKGPVVPDLRPVGVAFLPCLCPLLTAKSVQRAAPDGRCSEC